MTQVTRLGGVIPILNKGAVGYDPAEVIGSEDQPDPVDVAADGTGSVAEVPVALGGSVTLVQSKTGESANSTTIVSADYDDAPAQGNLLTINIEVRNNSAITTPTGWTLLDAVATQTPGGNSMAAFYKIAGAAEPTTVTVATTAESKRMVIAEWSGVGVLDTSSSLTNQGAATSHSIGPLTPTAGVPALVIAAFVKNVADFSSTAFTPGTGYTELDDAKTYGNVGPRYEVEYQLVGSTSGTYSPDTTHADNETWGAIAAVFIPVESGFLWVPAPATIDANDATYESVPTATPD